MGKRSRTKRSNLLRQEAGKLPPSPTHSPHRTIESLSLTVIIGLATVLLFWDLGETYLWQDEAATAVLSARMLKFGRPLAYDGLNLITNDNFASEDLTSVDRRTGDPKAAVDYYTKRGDFKEDTSWKYQPWGQFIITGVSLKLLGQTTFAARLPFSIAGLASVVLLYWIVRKYFNSPLMANFAALLLVFNAYWILHSRQCRYYSLSSLFLLLTFLSYARWQWDRARWGAAVFAIVAWCWFQVDYGTVWPVFGVLFLDALLRKRTRDLWEPLLTGLVLFAAILPFVFYYELWGRLSVQTRSWGDRFLGNLININQYIVPLLVAVVAVALVGRRWLELADAERRLVAIGCLVVIALVIWVPSVAPESFLRYVVPAAPIGALLAAWVLVRAFESLGAAFAGIGIGVLTITPLLSMPLNAIVTQPNWLPLPPNSIIRPELSILASDVFGHRPDPNRIVVEWLKQNAAPTDEILINYEDVPLMFYLPNPIRGGIAAFRAEDDAKGPPQFLVIRRSVGFVHWPVFKRVAERYQWVEVSTKAPDIIWGNNPDPMGKAQDPSRATGLLLARRVN